MQHDGIYDNYQDPRDPRGCLNFIAFVFGMIFFLCMIFFLSACSPRVMTVTQYKEIAKHDTVQTIDSVVRDRVRTVIVKGDTVRIHDSVYMYGYRWRDRIVREVQRDSIPYPVEVVREVRVRSRYDRFCSGVVWVLVILLILCGLWKAADYIPAVKPYKTMIKTAFKLWK